MACALVACWMLDCAACCACTDARRHLNIIEHRICTCTWLVAWSRLITTMCHQSAKRSSLYSARSGAACRCSGAVFYTIYYSHSHTRSRSPKKKKTQQPDNQNPVRGISAQRDCDCDYDRDFDYRGRGRAAPCRACACQCKSHKTNEQHQGKPASTSLSLVQESGTDI